MLLKNYTISILSILLSLCVLCACSDEVTKMVPEKEDNTVDNIEAMEGLLRIKLSAEWGDKINEITRSGEINTNNSVLDSIAAVFGVEELRRTFPPTRRFEERSRKAGLHLWYDVNFDKKHAVTRAAQGLKEVPGVDIVESIPKIRVVPTQQNAVVLNNVTSRAEAADALPFDDPHLNLQWHYKNTGKDDKMLKGADINIFPAWEQSVGSGDIIIAVVDGGIDYLHEDLAANMWVNEAELNGIPGEDSDGNGYVDDIYGSNFLKDSIYVHPHLHGTHVAGLVGAVNNNGKGVCGVAGGDGTPNSGVKLMSCQIFDYDDNGKEIGSDRIPEAIKYAADNGAIICQNSWGYDQITYIPQSLLDAFDYFITYAGVDEHGNQTGPMRGGILFFAAGNRNVNLFSPAFSPKVTSVAAMASNFKRASYSCYGDWVDIIAPGGEQKFGTDYMILSTIPNNEYGYMEGTSMACPQVSGVAALILAKYGGLDFTPNQLREYLFKGVGDIDGFNPGYIASLGCGFLNAAGALYSNGGEHPDTITDFKGVVSHRGIDLFWSAVADREDISPRNYRIEYLLKPNEGKGTTDNVQTINYQLEKPTMPGNTLNYLINDVLPDTAYLLRIRAIDASENESLPSLWIECATRTVNLPPYITQPLKDYVFTKIGETHTLNLDDYFADDDGTIQYSIQFADVAGYIWKMNGSQLSITITEPFVTTVTVTATDDVGVKCRQVFSLSYESDVEGPVIYPNPVGEYLYILMPPTEHGEMSVELYTLYGVRVLHEKVNVECNVPVKLATTVLNSGMYTLKCQLNNRKYQFSMVKQ
ncbi:MAG: S8 family serine peptidase [Marinifilaceae bacterium]